MQNSKMINELFALRSIACLSIVFLHAVGIALESSGTLGLGTGTAYFFDSVNIFLYFGTPLFIFMSELLIAYSYRNKKIPGHFLSKRFKYIFLPFLFMALFYSLPYMSSFSEWSTKLFLNAIIGDFHGYFVLIIFQFYLLHMLLHRFLKNWNPKAVLFIAFIINAGYLAVFNFISPPLIMHGEYLWTRFYWVPFLGWIFYFVLGYYAGYYYESFLNFLQKYKQIILAAPVFTTALLLFLYHSDLLAVHSSKRVDIILHTTAVALFLFYVTGRMKKVPDFLVRISQYSFGIYLLHMFFISAIDFLYQQYPLQLGPAYIFILFIFSTGLSVVSIYYINQWKYGKYFIGKIGVGTKSAAGKSPAPVLTEKRTSLREEAVK